jgi:hypothetical protein
VRAGMVDTAERWAWSSAAAHCAGSSQDGWLAGRMWRRRWADASWREYLKAGESESKLVAIRRYTHTGRPLGDVEFVRALEKETKRLLALQKRGPKKERASGTTPGHLLLWLTDNYLRLSPTADFVGVLPSPHLLAARSRQSIKVNSCPHAQFPFRSFPTLPPHLFFPGLWTVRPSCNTVLTRTPMIRDSAHRMSRGPSCFVSGTALTESHVGSRQVRLS